MATGNLDPADTNIEIPANHRKDVLFTSFLFTIPLLHLLLAPHTKVEESFNLQAAHDILVYGTPTSGDVHARLAHTYDHFTFPGAVPRTFLGPVLLAGLGQPLVAVAGFRHAQLIVRGLLGVLNATALLVLRNALRRAFGRGVARWWVVMLVGQFHVNYYLSRTLPNMYAFGLTTLASAFLLPQPNPQRHFIRQKQAIALLILAGVIFRSEVALLLITTALHLLASRRVTLLALIPVSLGSFLAALVVSVPIDCYFWQRPLWPELAGFYYNAILGSSSNWGVSPWHYYFTSALPRILLNPLVPMLIAFALFQPGTSRAARALVIPNLLYVAIYSLQPHKEARFIFYVAPALTAAAALGADFISTRAAKSLVYRAVSLALVLSVLGSFAASIGMLLLSSLNYPGGDALEQLKVLTRDDPTPVIRVHADVLTCMTGLTLFGQNPAGHPIALDLPLPQKSDAPVLLFDKTESGYQMDWPAFWEKFDYLLVEDTSKVLGRWEIIGMVQGYDGIEVLKPGSHPGGETDSEEAGRVGVGAQVAGVRDFVRGYTGGWWAGPRMSPRIYILRQDRIG
ncbi:Dol-P-Man:Man(7)GlcNAc(2)-PP-Dol alpha-1,6-mannosyltransferase [Neonectria punicea]|uniref:Mannosyltransferase n=1 Tax=Neonectria punicea TaxID=979145 RepID=A0ABR1HJN8_9HYPO